MHKLPRKQKKYFIAVHGANEYYYQMFLLEDSHFSFMKWQSFEKVTKQQYKQHLKNEKRKKA